VLEDKAKVHNVKVKVLDAQMTSIHLSRKQHSFALQSFPVGLVKYGGFRPGGRRQAEMRISCKLQEIWQPFMYGICLCRLTVIRSLVQSCIYQSPRCGQSFGEMVLSGSLGVDGVIGVVRGREDSMAGLIA